MVENQTTPTGKKSLSKFGGFNQSMTTPKNRDSDDEDYGKVETEEDKAVKKILKKSLSKYGSHSVEKIVKIKETDSDEEDYGNVDPAFKPEKVAYTSKGELVVIPEDSAPKTIRKTLSKYGTPSSVQKTPNSAVSGDSDDDYGNLEVGGNGQKKLKKSLSKYSQNNNVETTLNFDKVQITSEKDDDDDDNEDYGQIDPTFHTERVSHTASGKLVVPPDPKPKTIKKTLSKYDKKVDSPFHNQPPPQTQQNTAKELLSSNDPEDSDEDYGAMDPAFLDSAKTKSRKSLKASDLENIGGTTGVPRTGTTDSEASNSGVKALIAKIESKVNN